MNDDMTPVSDALSIPNTLLAEINKNVSDLKKNDPTLRVVFPLIVQGESYDNKAFYVGYFRQPSLPIFSKYVTASQHDSVTAMKTLASDCFLAGDKELINDDSLFMFGLLQQMTKIIAVRHGALVNLSNPGK